MPCKHVVNEMTYTRKQEDSNIRWAIAISISHLLKGKLVFLAGEDSEGDKMGSVLEIGGARCDTVTHCPRDTRCLLRRLGIFCKT